MLRALLVDDDVSSLDALAELVRTEGFDVTAAPDLAAARQKLKGGSFDVILTDLMLPDGTGTELLGDPAAGSGTDVVLITGQASVASAVETLRKGASDYLTKPIVLARLRAVLSKVSRRRELKHEVQTLRSQLRRLGRFGSLIVASPEMDHVCDLIDRVAPTNATVLITGESGTGKDLVARSIHDLSRRRRGPFLAINCGAVAPNLIESELFGHERGSFTGAERQHRGIFERAGGGTLFLDEITEMPPELQAKLLRVLETEKIIRVGGESPIAVDVRVTTATNRDPNAAVRDGKLREDLLYRLKVFPIHLPPLRERQNEVEILAQHFLNEMIALQGLRKSLTDGALHHMQSYRWPGNVRELRNVVHRAYILAVNEVDEDCLPPRLRGETEEPGWAKLARGPAVQVRVGSTVAEAERRLILATLDEFAGNKQRAADALGISIKTLYNRLSQYRAQTRESA